MKPDIHRSFTSRESRLEREIALTNAKLEELQAMCDAKDLALREVLARDEKSTFASMGEIRELKEENARLREGGKVGELYT